MLVRPRHLEALPPNPAIDLQAPHAYSSDCVINVTCVVSPEGAGDRQESRELEAG